MTTAPRIRRNIIYTAVEVVLNGIGLFVIYRLVVQVLGIQMLGIWSLVLATTAFGRMADIGIAAGLSRFVAREMGQYQNNVARYVETALIVVVVTMGIISLIAYIPIVWAISLTLSGAELELARSLVPYALLTFFLLNINAVMAATLLGSHRADLRSISNILGMLMQVGCSFLLVRGHGLMGLAWAQTAQYIVAISLAWFFILRLHPSVSTLPCNAHLPVFKELIRFGAKLQVGTVANLLFEPASKIVIGHIGGTAMLGLFELAYRMVYQVRNIVIMGVQNLIPIFTQLFENDRVALLAIFNRAIKLTSLFGVLGMSGIALAAPLVSYLWMGHYDAGFVQLAAVLAFCWAVNIFSAPAYFLGVSTGNVNVQIIGQVITGFLSPTLGYALGMTYGGYGAVFGVVFGKVVGDLMPAYANRPGKSLSTSVIASKFCILSTFVQVMVSAAVYILAGRY
ncbi:oligosaccharide flippase family protein [Xanthobacter flavus]|uniref:oligosaccharide flippase family protein n=1 Tax=Xanthobacter flavus TaxID=281 RepID=UPI00372AD8CF